MEKATVMEKDIEHTVELEADSETVQNPGRIRYADDVEIGPRRGRTRRDSRERRQSADSMSIRSMRSISMSVRRDVVDPGVLLPIQYRTVSFNVEESKARDLKGVSKLDETTTEFVELDWHLLSVDEVLRRLSTSLKQGLSSEQAARKLKDCGLNVFSQPPSGWFWKTVKYFFGGFGSILFIASILVFIAWKPLGQPPSLANLALAIVLAVVFLVQAGFNIYQDWSTSRVMASITNMLPDECTVIRDGQQEWILGCNIVPGDLIRIKMGDKLPADVRFVQTSPDAKFDRSVLTGETVPIHGTVDSTDNNFLETACIGMAGTHCVSGESLGVVIATGDRSVFGKIAKLTTAPKSGLTNLEKEIYYFVGAIVSIMILMILIVIIAWAAWLRHDHPSWINVPVLIVDCVSVAVSFIPEGLPIAVTASLTITAKIMKRNQILCKSLKTVETLGSVSVICSDKTGTLTKNKMTVTDCLIGNDLMTASAAAGIVQLSQKGSVNHPAGLLQLAQAGGLCNAGEFDVTTNHLPLEQRKIFGDATDQAVLRFAESLESVAEMRAQWKITYRLPFNSKNKFMIHVMESGDSAESVLTIKGAPDILLPRCTQFIDTDGSARPLTPDHLASVQNIKDTWSSQAKRVILLARKNMPDTMPSDPQSLDFETEAQAQATNGLQLVGLVGIVDPPREEIPEVVRTLRRAGIKVHMVTGDFKLTAQAIAADCGIITQTPDRIHDVSALSSEDASQLSDTTRSIVMSGSDLTDLDDEQWNRLCKYEEIVFARTTPDQKLKIVKELQKREEVVGMTGDGVNDAPSLKAADIGIAMGGGSDIAIEAADMVLLDSFSAIVEAVKYGRVVFDNLKKTICYLIPAGTFSEFWPVMTNVLFGLPQILSSFNMIIICCFTDCAAATAIAYEQPERDVLLQRPRNTKKDHLVNWKLILQAYGFLGIQLAVSSFAMSYWYAERAGVPFSTLWFGFGRIPAHINEEQYTLVLNRASSVYFVNLVVMQWFNLMAVRTRRLSILQHPPFFSNATSNYYLFPAIVFAALIAVFFLYVPKFHSVLGTATVPAEHWFLPMAFGMGLLLLDESRKWAARKWPKGIVARYAW